MADRAEQLRYVELESVRSTVLADAHTDKLRAATCFLRLSLTDCFPSESPITASLSTRSSEFRSSPARRLNDGRQSDGAPSGKVQLSRAIVDGSLCHPLVDASWAGRPSETAGLVLRERSPAVADP